MSRMSERLQGHADRIRDGRHRGGIRWQTMQAYAREAEALQAKVADLQVQVERLKKQ